MVREVMHGKQERDTVLLQAPAALLGSHRSIRRADTTLTWKGGCENMPAGDNKPRPTNIIWSDNKNSSYKKKINHANVMACKVS